MDSQPVKLQTDSISLVPGSSTVGFWGDAQAKLDRDLKREAEGRALLQQLQTLDRQAFRPTLIKLMLGAPTVDDIAIFAARDPARYMQALGIAARLSGYSERPEDGASLSAPFANISGLSDSELVAKLNAIDANLQAVAGRAPQPEIADGEYREADSIADLI